MKTIIWPVYLNSNCKRSQGRKLSIEDSIEDPKLREISQALRRMKVQHVVDHGKSYPGSWWENSGQVVVEQDEKTKLELLHSIAREIKSSRNRT